MSSNCSRQSSEVALLLWAGVVATSFFTLAPALVGALVDELHLSVRAVGFISSAQLAGSALGNLLVLVYGRRMTVRTALVLAAAVIGLSDWATALAQEPLTIGLCRLLAGLAGGAAFAVVNALAARLPRSGAMFAALSIVQMLFGLVGFLGLPPLLGTHGVAGAFIILSACSGVCVLGAVFFARKTPIHTHSWCSSVAVTPRGALLLLALLTTYLANTALWTYLERIGVAAGLTGQVISLGLSVGMVAGILGAVAAAWLLRRPRNPDRALLAGSVLLVLGTGLLLGGPIPSTYCLALFGFNTALALITPLYLVRLAAEDCGDGRVLVAMLAMYLGFIGGPMLGAALVSGRGYGVLTSVCTGLFAVAALLVCLGLRAGERWGQPRKSIGSGIVSLEAPGLPP